MSQARQADAEARRRAQRIFEHPLVLEAGAGTGKTATLVARVLAWCLGPGWEEARVELERDAPPARSTPAAAAGITAQAVAARTLEGVVAITFTEAAAAEMAERVGQALVQLERGEEVIGFAGASGQGPSAEGGEKARARQLLAQLDRLRVTTIHAFCRHLLTAHPLEAGVAPRFEVDAEGDLLDEVLREVLDEYLRRAYSPGGSAGALRLAGAGAGPDEIAAALRRLVEAGVEPEALEADPWSSPPAIELLERIAAAVASFSAVVPATALECLDAKGRNGRKGALVLRGIGALGLALASGELSPAADRERFQALADLAEESLGADFQDRLKDWSRGKLTGAEAACLGDLDEASLATPCGALLTLIPVLCRLDPEVYDAGREVLAPVLREVRRRMQERGIVTFQELLSRARDLLRAHPELRALERRKIRQLLVDEFQDTDRLQCDIVGDLALDGPTEQRPGLFLVGDPKQSIYGWRNADLAAYEAFVARVVANGGQVERLAVNFRSAPPLLDEVERLLSPVMREEPRVQPPFERLLPCAALRDAEGFVAAGRRPIEHWISWRVGGEDTGSGPKTRASVATRIEARAIAEEIRCLHHEHGVAWGEVGFLLRSVGDLEVYLRALQEAGVPYAVARDRSYYQRREIIDVAALVRAVLDPADHLALVTALRAAWVAVPDAALPRLWQRGLPRLATELVGPDETVLQRVRTIGRKVAAELRALEAGADAIPGLAALAGWEESLVHFFAVLGRLRLAFVEEPADCFVEALRSSLLIEAVEAVRFLGAWRLANLERFFRDLASALDEGGNVEAVLRVLRRSVAESREAREGRPREAATDAVQVMTIHKAKGLDFRQVFLAQLAKRSGQRPGARPTRVERTDGAGAEGFWCFQLFGSAGPGWWLAAEREARVRAAEQVRLLYVATTRAKERLVLVGNAVIRARDPGDAGCFAELVAGRDPAPPDLEAALAAGDAAGADQLDDQGIRWYFPDAQRSPAPEAAPADALAPAPVSAERAAFAPDAVQRAAAEHLRLGEEAARRQARPLRGAVSQEAHRLLEELLERAGEEGGRPELTGARAGVEEPLAAPGLDSVDRAVAMVVGTAVHSLFELFDHHAPDADEELDRRREERVRTLMEDAGPGGLGGLRPAEQRQAIERYEELLRAFRAGPLWPRFLALREQIIARELPVLLPPGEGEGLHDPVGFLSGTVDLVYRDPEDGGLVIADYKTDPITDERSLTERAATYAHQGRLYQRALQQALDLPEPPRFELWFVAAGRVVSSP